MSKSPSTRASNTSTTKQFYICSRIRVQGVPRVLLIPKTWLRWKDWAGKAVIYRFDYRRWRPEEGMQPTNFSWHLLWRIPANLDWMWWTDIHTFKHTAKNAPSERNYRGQNLCQWEDLHRKKNGSLWNVSRYFTMMMIIFTNSIETFSL